MTNAFDLLWTPHNFATIWKYRGMPLVNRTNALIVFNSGICLNNQQCGTCFQTFTALVLWPG